MREWRGQVEDADGSSIVVMTMRNASELAKGDRTTAGVGPRFRKVFSYRFQRAVMPLTFPASN
jgi:hypothetical protein